MLEIMPAVGRDRERQIVFLKDRSRARKALPSASLAWAVGWRPTIVDTLSIFHPAHGPRQFGGLVAACGLPFFLRFAGAEWAHAILISGGWSLGVLLAANFNNFPIRGFKAAPVRSMRSSWSRVLFGSWGGACLVNLCVGTPLPPEQMLGALALPTAVFYAFCKIGCLKYTCCGWPAGSRLGRFVPLQIIEAALSLAIATVTCVAWIGTSPSVVLTIFLVGHCLQRVASKVIRARWHHAVISPEVAVVLLTIGRSTGG